VIARIRRGLAQAKTSLQGRQIVAPDVSPGFAA
jgi:hypothetical protein